MNVHCFTFLYLWILYPPIDLLINVLMMKTGEPTLFRI